MPSYVKMLAGLSNLPRRLQLRLSGSGGVCIAQDWVLEQCRLLMSETDTAPAPEQEEPPHPDPPKKSGTVVWGEGPVSSSAEEESEEEDEEDCLLYVPSLQLCRSVGV